MSLEPGMAEYLGVAPDVATDWRDYRKCGTCRAETGDPCTSMATAIRDGRPDGPRKPLNVPHAFRERRAGR